MNQMLLEKTRKPKVKRNVQNKEIRNRKFESKYGYFTADGREYVITRPDTPRPWVNVISNGNYGIVESQNGSGFSWRGNANLSRITRWEQDLIKDTFGKFIYVRDNDSGKMWSATYKPCCVELDFFEVRHGIGYSILTSQYEGIRVEKTIFVDADDAVEVWQLRVANESQSERHLSLFSYFEWCLGNAADTHREFHKTFIETEFESSQHALYGRKRQALVPGFISTGLSERPLASFHAITNLVPTAHEGDKENFFGRYGGMRRPEAVVKGQLTSTAGKHYDSIASLQADLAIEPGATKTVIYVLGATGIRAQGKRIIQNLNSEEKVDEALRRVKTFWRDLLDRTLVDTPDESLNFMTNVWLKYQAISARLWAKCGYYQSSGGYGFRDQLQDSLVFLPLKPEWAKRQIFLHAQQQFPDGTVHHWWHPGTRYAAVTNMTDDLLWLVFITTHYLNETGDFLILNERLKFLPDPKTKKVLVGSLYDHCLRAIDRVLARFSKRGLPLMGEGDWNDGLSHVGIEWKGESIWLGHFLYGVLKQFAPICLKRRDRARSVRYHKRADALKAAINRHAWDGEWYIRATRDDGRPLGSKSEPEGKIYLNAQTWSVIHGTATPERVKRCMASCEKYLFRNFGPLLLTPAYTRTDPTIGYITRYAPAVRENGGVYCHAATWAVQALTVLGEGDKAYQMYRSFMPILRGAEPDLYYAEPYVMPGNVDGPESPHPGRGGWTWYTGTASWYFRIALNWILGIDPTVEGLRINPCIPKKWDGFKVKRLFRGTTYEITVENPKHVSTGVKKITVDGRPIDGNMIRPLNRRTMHKVHVIMG